MQYAFDFGECFASVDHGQGALRARSPRPPTRPPVVLPCLPGLERARYDTLFFGLQPDVPAAEHIENRLIPPLVLNHGLTGEPLGRLRWHITLLGLGCYDGVPRALVASAGEAAAGLSVAGFEVNFDRVMSFRRTGGLPPLVLAGGDAPGALRDLRRALAEAMAGAGVAVSRAAAFTPHLTLLYDRRMVPECAVPPVGWRVRDFVLVHSLRGFSRHVVLGRWPLEG